MKNKKYPENKSNWKYNTCPGQLNIPEKNWWEILINNLICKVSPVNE